MKDIKVQDSTWEKLVKLKIEKKIKSIDLLILEILKKYKE